MFDIISNRFDKITKWVIAEKQLKEQTDWVIPGLNLFFSFIALWLFFDNRRLSDVDLTLILFSTLASLLVVISWEISFEISTDIKRNHVDLCLYFIAWAIIFWQFSTIINSKEARFLNGDTNTIIASALSTLNSVFFLFSAIDFDYPPNQMPHWTKWKLLKSFQSRKAVLLIGISVIILDSILSIFAHSLPYSNLIRYPWLFDFILSIITIWILGEGFIILFTDRFKNENQRYASKQLILNSIIVIVFGIVFLAQIRSLLNINMISGKIDEIKTLNDIISLTYRIFITLLFFMLQMSWIMKNRRDISNRNETLTKDNIDLKGENTILVSEVSHRAKNHLLSLESGLIRQLSKTDVLANSIAESELSASLARIRTTLNIHSLLDYSEDKDNIPLLDYLQKICGLHKNLFDFSDENFIEVFDDSLLSRAIPFAEARYIGLIITELLINVDQHSYEHTVKKWVKVECGGFNERIESNMMRKWLTITVSDKGKGMPTDIEPGRGLLILDEIVKNQLGGTIDTAYFDIGKSIGNTTYIKIPQESLSF